MPPPRFSPAARARIAAAVLLITVAALLRFTALSSLPPGLFRDEIEKGWTAYELWHTGRQAYVLPGGAMQTSGPLPVFIDAVGVKTSAIYQYLSAPVVGIFGLNATTTRFAAALCGLLTVLAAFGLAQVLVRAPHRDESVRPAPDAAVRWLFPLAALAFVALSPNHVLFSRWAQQGITVPLLTTVGVWLVLRVPELATKHRRAAAACAGLAFAGAFYAYAPARLVVPLVLLALAFETRGSLKERARMYWPAALVFFAFAIPVFLYFVTQGSGRFSRISVLADRSIIEGVMLALQNYISHFDPRFLFFSGDANPRHGLFFSGVIAWAEVPFFLIGFVTLFKFRNPGSALLLGWMLAAPVAASLTADGVPHALRSILLWPAVHLISAQGVVLVAEKVSAKVAAGALGAAALITLVLTGVGLQQTRWQAAAWQYGVPEALGEMWKRNPQGPNALSVEVPYALNYVLFHEQPDPAAWQEQGPEALRTMLVAPGTPLPPGALVARPPQSVFEKTQPTDIPPLKGEGPPAMTIRSSW